jgi:GntR family transcriptional regulator, uxu operon transcriptional repressor
MIGCAEGDAARDQDGKPMATATGDSPAIPADRGRRLAEVILASSRRAGLGPGSRLPTERQLAADLGATRTTIRRALAVLEAEGHISREVGRGTFLRDARWARPSADAGGGPGPGGAGSYDEFELWDLALHRCIMAASHSPLLARLYAVIEEARHSQFWGDLKRRSASRERQRLYQADHRELVAALRARDADRAVEAMRTHLARVSSHLFDEAS